MLESEIVEENLTEFEKKCRRAGFDDESLISALDELIQQADARRKELISFAPYEEEM